MLFVRIKQHVRKFKEKNIYFFFLFSSVSIIILHNQNNTLIDLNGTDIAIELREIIQMRIRKIRLNAHIGFAVFYQTVRLYENPMNWFSWKKTKNQQILLESFCWELDYRRLINMCTKTKSLNKLGNKTAITFHIWC